MPTMPTTLLSLRGFGFLSSLGLICILPSLIFPFSLPALSQIPGTYPGSLEAETGFYFKCEHLAILIS
jgi:hypothetical protein